MTYKILFYVTLILLAIWALFYFYSKPNTTLLERSQTEQREIDHIDSVIIPKIQALLQHYTDSIRASQTREVVYIERGREREREIIQQPVTTEEEQINNKFFTDFYELKSRETGLELPELSLSDKRIKGQSLLINDYETRGLIITELRTQNELFIERDRLHVEEKSAMQKKLDLKERQLTAMERTRIPIISSRKWYVDVALVGGSLAVGFTAGIIYTNLKK